MNDKFLKKLPSNDNDNDNNIINENENNENENNEETNLKENNEKSKQSNKFTIIQKISLILFILFFILAIVGVMALDWWFKQMGATFLVLGIILIFLLRKGEQKGLEIFMKGLGILSEL